jgi:membrane associated rhomboid family serine protease
MIPIRDSVRARRWPVVNYALIALCAWAFWRELAAGPDVDALIESYALTPATFVKSIARHGWLELAQWEPFVSSMFLHGGFAHFAGNMLFLWIFGDNVEDHMGHFPYLIFYLLCGVVAALTDFALSPLSTVPMIGASGAIAGVMGAYFLLYPKANVLTWVTFIFFWWIPAWVWLGVWFLLQFFLTSVMAGAVHHQTGGVAFAAHVGGFITGLVLIKVFPKRSYATRYGTW